MRTADRAESLSESRAGCCVAGSPHPSRFARAQSAATACRTGRTVAITRRFEGRVVTGLKHTCDAIQPPLLDEWPEPPKPPLETPLDEPELLDPPAELVPELLEPPEELLRGELDHELPVRLGEIETPREPVEDPELVAVRPPVHGVRAVQELPHAGERKPP